MDDVSERSTAERPGVEVSGHPPRLLVACPTAQEIVEVVLNVVRARQAGGRVLIAVPGWVAARAWGLYEQLHEHHRPPPAGAARVMELPYAEELAAMAARVRLGIPLDGPDAPDGSGTPTPIDEDVALAAALFDRVAPGGA